MRSLILLTTALWAATPAAAQRHRDGHRLRSDSLPAAVFTFDSTLTYLGTQSFILYGTARAEQHFFGELDGQRLKRFVWIQFEGYLPDNQHTYDYAAFPTVLISGRPFHHNGEVRHPGSGRPRPGSDGERMYRFLTEPGYTLPSEVLYQRLVWLIDQPARNEVMVIYMEDLTRVPEGRRAGRRAGLLSRATGVFAIGER